MVTRIDRFLSLEKTLKGWLAHLGVELTVVPLLVTLILALTPTLKPVDMHVCIYVYLYLYLYVYLYLILTLTLNPVHAELCENVNLL